MLMTAKNVTINWLNDSPITIPTAPVPKKASMITLSFFGGMYLIDDLLRI
jgi:hypothetical protein